MQQLASQIWSAGLSTDSKQQCKKATTDSFRSISVDLLLACELFTVDKS